MRASRSRGAARVEEICNANRPRRPGGGIFLSPPSFESKLEREEDVLDALVSAFARGQLAPETWTKLHEAAVRDERVSELAFAYESYAQGRRAKMFPAPVVAELLFRAATFFADVLGDNLVARNYLERVLATVPAHQAAFERLDALLAKAGEVKKLAEVYVAAAPHRPREAQIELLRKAAQLLEKSDAGEERSIEIHQQLLRLDPSDAGSRKTLEEKYLRTNRHREVARLLEQAFAADPPPPAAEARAMRARLIELYASQLHEPERTIPHVEALLAVDPSNDEARRAATKLVAIKGLAARAAAALADATEKVGVPDDVARYLAIELEHTRGPKRREVLTRLAVLRQDRLNDPGGAYDALEQACFLDPSEDDDRIRFMTLALKLGKPLDAARTLSRVGTVAKDAKVRARISAETGELLAAGGDTRRARSTFVAVLGDAHGRQRRDPQGGVRARRYLSGRERLEVARRRPREDRRDRDGAGAEAKSARPARRARRERVLKDPTRAIAAWKELAITPGTRLRARGRSRSSSRSTKRRRPTANSPGYWKSGRRTRPGAKPRQLAVRSAEVLTRVGDVEKASLAWKRVVDKFGASRDVLARWMPLLESARQWGDLADALAADAQLAPGAERAAIWARLGQIHLQRTRQIDEAIECFERALEVDATEKTSRAALEKLLALGEHRLAAAQVLEPLYRAEDGSGAPLLRVLDVKASLQTEGPGRLAALAEALTIAARLPQEKGRAIELAVRGLGEAVAQGAPLATWVARLDALAASGVDPKRLAALLGKALGERPVTSSELSGLAKRLGEAHAASGDVAAAIAAYRRALDFEPSSSELLGRVDDLLRDQGNPRERVELYRAALARGVDPRQRRELLHAIGALTRDELHDLPAAIESYKTALADDAEDRGAHAALVDLYSEMGAWEALSELLEQRVARVSGSEAVTVRAQLAELAATHGQNDRARTHATALLTHPDLPVSALDVIERVAERLADVPLARAVLERRATEASDAREQVGWLTRLGSLENERARDVDAAVAAWKRAAALAHPVGDDLVTRDLYERIREASPGDLHATSRLADLLERAEAWDRLPALYAILVDGAATAADAVATLVRAAQVYAEKLGDLQAASSTAERAFLLDPLDHDLLAAYERYALAAGELRQFGRVLGEALASGAATADSGARADIALARARALAKGAESRGDAIDAYRAVLSESPDAARTRYALESLQALLEAEGAEARAKDWRWLHSWRVAHAADGEKATAMLVWAADEETRLADPAQALSLYREVLALDSENVEAMGSIARLALASGDVDGALAALVARRDRCEGAARSASDLEIATVLLDRGVRRADALRSVAAVLESTPSDPTALALSARLLQSDDSRAPAIVMLERTLEGVDDPEVRAQILVRLLETPTDAAARDLRRGWFERLLDLRQSRGELEEALATIVRAAEELPTVASLWDRAESLARAAQRPDEVAALYTKVLLAPLGREEALELGQRAVAFHEEWFEDSERVVRILERMVEIDPSDVWGFERLKLIFDAAERWDDLFVLYDKAIAVASGARRVELLEDAAQVAKDFANRSERAIGYLEQLVALRPDPRLAASLERLYERHGRHRELVWLLHTRLPQLGLREAQAVRARMAGVLLTELGDAGSALAVMEELIAKGGDEAVDVAGLLERILATAPPTAETRESMVPPPDGGSERPSRGPSGAPSVKRPLVRQRAAALLKERYTEAGRDADLVRVLEIELESVKSVRERIRRHKQIADLYTGLGQETQALEHAVSLVLLEPDVVVHREQLAQLAARVGRSDRLAEVLVAAAEDCTDDSLRIDLLMQAGAVHADALEDPGRATDLFFRVLDVPGHDAAHLSAARRLSPLLARAHRPYERLDVMERVAALEPVPEARREELGEIAALAASLGESDRAILAWQLRLRDDPSDADALEGLTVLLEKERRWRPLIEVLDRRAATTTSDEQRRSDRVRAAEILRRELGAIDEAIVAWRAIESELGPSAVSTRALAALLRAAERWSDLAVVLTRAAAEAAEGTRADLLAELGDLNREHLGSFVEAVQAYESALAVAPRHGAARRGLHAAVSDGSARAAALAVLLRSYAEADEWRSILALLEPRLAAAEDASARVDILREAAQVVESRLEDGEGAFTLLRRALLADPAREDVAIDLRRVAEAIHAWRPLADAYREALDSADPAAPLQPWAKRVRLSFGEVLEARLDDPRAALTAYARVLADEPAHPIAARAAIRCACRVARWDAAAKILVDAAAASGAVDPALVGAVEEGVGGASAWDGLTSALSHALEERPLPAGVAREIEARLGGWHRDRRGDPEAAEEAFARALGHAPEDAELLAALTQLQRRTKGRPLVDSLLRLSAATGGDLDLLREAAEVARSSVSDRALAKGIIERVLRAATERWDSAGTEDSWTPPATDAVIISSGTASPPSAYVEWALREMSAIHEEEGEPARIVDLLLEASRLPLAPERTRALRHEAARIAADRTGEVDRAIAAWTSLVEEDPEDTVAAARLVSALEAHGRRTDLLEIRRRQTRAAKTSPMRVAVRLETARLESALGEMEAAITSLEANLAEDTRHEESVRALVALFEGAGRHAELAALLGRQAEREEGAAEPRAAADLWARAADVAEVRLGDKALAVRNHRRVIALEPRARSLDALARLLASMEDWEEAATHLASLLDVSEPRERARVALRLAEALTAAGDEPAARARLEEAFTRDSSAEEVVTRLATMYRAQGEWKRLADLLTRSAGHARDKAARLAALREAAALYRRECGTPAEAIALLEQASDLDPEDRGLRLALAEVLGATERYAEARAVLRALIDEFGGRRPKERAPVHYQLARLDLALGDRARALVELDAATRIDPANPEILRALAELARDDGQLERAERSYRALLAVLRRTEDPPSDAPIVRTEVLAQLATLARGANEPDRAAELVESALEIASKSIVEALRLEKALREQGDFATLARALDARIARGGEPELVAKAMADRAEMLSTHLGRASEAFDVALQAVALAPQLPGLHEAALALARRTGSLRTYADRLLAIAAAAEARPDEDMACDLALRVGAVFEHDLGDDAEAARHYEHAQRFQLRLPDVLRALDRVYERLGDTSAQARVLAKRIDVESMSSAAGVTTDAIYRLARLKLLRPDSLDEGCDLLVTALQVAPDYERAKGVLEAASALHPKSERLVEIYERIGKAPGQERALVDALTLRAELAGSGAEPLREAAEIARGRLGDVSLTESLLRRLIARAGEDAGARTHLTWALTTLGELREAAGDVADAVALKRQAADLAEGADARRLHFEVARLAKDSLQDLALAAKVYAQLHEHEPADREAWEPLLEVYRLTGAHAARAALIARVVEFVDDASERSRLRLERARVTMNELGAGDAAAPMLSELVDDDPSQVEAALLLAGILERGGQADELASLLARQIDAAKDRNDASSVAELSLRLGALVEKRSPVDARAVYYAALDWDAKNRDCLRALVRLHRADEDATDRVELMERLLPLEESERVEELTIEVADIRSALGDVESVRRALEAGFRARPGSKGLRERLEATYAAGGEWGSVAALHEADAQSRTDRAERVARLREAASVWSTKANDPARAAEVLRRARAEAQEDVALLGELVEILAASGDKAGAALELTLAIDWLGDENVAAVPLLAKRAGLRAELGDGDGALLDLEHAFRAGGSAYGAALIDLLEQLVAAAWEAGDSARWRAMRLRLAEVLAVSGDPDQARLFLTDLLKHEAKDRDALRALALLDERMEKWDAATATYRRLVALEDPENVAVTALRLADACERAGRLGDARGGLERARMVSPANDALTARLLTVYEATGAYRELALLHMEEAKAARDVAGKFAHLLRAGTLMVHNGGDPNAALVPLREANALRPGDLECSARLAEGLAGVGRAQEAIELLTALLAPHKGRRSRELALVHQAFARVARAAGETDLELSSLTAALDMDPQNGGIASELALVAREAGQLDLAQRALRAITMLKSPAPMSRGLAYQYLGEIAQKQGDVKRAVMLLKRAVDDDPNLASARALLSQLKVD